MPENDASDQIIRRLMTSEIRQELTKRASEFVRETERVQGERQRELLSVDDSMVLMEELNAATRDRVFGNPRFREAIFISWLDFSPDRQRFNGERLEELYFSFEDDLQSSCCELASDFEQLRFDGGRSRDVSDSIESHIVDEQYARALRVLRENRGLMAQKEYLRFLEIAWSRISRLDDRFRPIWSRCQSLCGRAPISFPLDRPAIFSGSDKLQNELEAQSFVAETNKLLVKRENGKLDILNDEDTAELWSELDRVQGFKHFDSLVFREYLLIVWRDLTESASPTEIEEALELWSKLDSSQRRLANDFLDDFDLLLSRPDVGREVERLIEAEDYVGAFTVVRRYCWDGKLSSNYRGKIWKALAEVFNDPGFIEIASAFDTYSAGHAVLLPAR